MKHMLAALGLAMTVLVVTPSCHPHHMGPLLEATVHVAATAAWIAMTHHHYAHYHSYSCGCPHAYIDGQDAFYYDDHWEYYDPYEDVWYVYVEE